MPMIPELQSLVVPVNNQSLASQNSMPDVSLNWTSSSIIQSVNSLFQSMGFEGDYQNLFHFPSEEQFKIEDDTVVSVSQARNSEFHFGSLTKYSHHSSVHFLDIAAKEFAKNPDGFLANLDLTQNQILSASDFLAATARKKVEKKNKRIDLTKVYQSTILENPH